MHSWTSRRSAGASWAADPRRARAVHELGRHPRVRQSRPSQSRPSTPATPPAPPAPHRHGHGHMLPAGRLSQNDSPPRRLREAGWTFNTRICLLLTDLSEMIDPRLETRRLGSEVHRRMEGGDTKKTPGSRVACQGRLPILPAWGRRLRSLTILLSLLLLSVLLTSCGPQQNSLPGQPEPPPTQRPRPPAVGPAGQRTSGLPTGSTQQRSAVLRPAARHPARAADPNDRSTDP